MRIDKIGIQNFRNIGEMTEYRLNPNFTAIIGINGKGKSSILNALKIASGAYLLGIPDASKRHIYESEIRRTDHGSHLIKNTPVIIRAEGEIYGQRLSKSWCRQIPEGRYKTTANEVDIGEIKTIAQERYTSYLHGTQVDNPVIAFFGTERLNGSGRNTLGPYNGREVFKYGYYNWHEMQAGTYNYVSWLQSHRFMVKEKRESADLYKAFLQAIKLAIPYIKDLDFDGQELRLKVRMINGEEAGPYLPLSLQSDGVKTMTAMVAELAYRCIMLNAHFNSNAIRNSQGIVMVDELDLHLHPNWQRHVVADLKSAFPKIQFIVTTHSPFIVQSLRNDELINLDAIADISPKDLTLDEVSTHVMRVVSEYSVENEDKYNSSKNVLKKLRDPKVSIREIEEEMKEVSDPALRAFLELNKMAKGK